MESDLPTEVAGEQSEPEQSLHPLSWLFMTGAASKGLVGPWLLLLFASGGSYIEVFSVLFAVPALIGAFLKHAVFRYRLGAEEIVIRDGVLTRNERHIPYTRIQNIDLVQNPIHRLFGVALVRLETASGQRPEAVIRVLSLEAIERLRQRVQAQRGSRDKIREDEARVLLHLPDTELVRLGLISNRGMLVLAAISGLLWQVGGWEQQMEELSPELLRQFGETTADFGFGLGLLAVLILLILLRLFSVAWYLFTLHDFQLRIKADDLRTVYGLLNRVSATIPIRRIQLISCHATLLHRLFHRVSVQLETAGSIGGPGEGGEFDTRKEAPWLAPVLPEDRLPGLLREVLPEVDLRNLDWQPLAAGARKRLIRRGMILSLLGGAAFFPTFQGWALGLLPVFFAWTLLHATLFVRNTQYALADWGVAFRSGWWVRRLSLLGYAKSQSAWLAESPFDRRHGMASLRVDTAGAGKLNHRIDIPFLEAGVARAIRERIHAEASRRSFRW